MSALRIENLAKSFGKVKALTNINLQIQAGTFCVVLGPSGCGKSTLLNLIAGLEQPSEGRIYLGEKDITELPPHQRNMAMVFQNYALYPHLSAYENIAFGLRIKKEDEDKIAHKIKDVSKILGIADKLDKFPRQLSGGERQRVATGRAIVREPTLFLFDEPLSNLDARLRIELRAQFIKLHRQLKKTIIYVTHDQVEAMVLGEEVVVLKDGQIQQVSSPQELYHNPGNLFVAEFIGTPPMNIIQLQVSRFNSILKLTKDEFNLEHRPDFQEALRDYIGQDIYFGFRATAARLAQDGQIKGEVLFTQTQGEDSFAHIRVHPEIELIVKIEQTQKLKAQDSVSISIDKSRSYFFDARGIRIRTVKQQG